MSASNPLLRYDHRHYGMDHDRYDWSMLEDRSPIQWPDGKKVALWVNVSLQQFPLAQTDKTFPVHGGMRMPYPDLRHYSLRDYGNRVGVYRVLKVLDAHGIKPTVAMNSDLAKTCPALLRRIVDREDEIIAQGVNMDALHHSGVDPALEAERVRSSVETLRDLTGQPILGWLSPGKSQSFCTPDLLAQNGVRYMCDWVNDDLPYPFRTDHGDLVALPMSTELEDTHILLQNQHSEESYVEQVTDACAFLRREAHKKGGRLLSLSLHPWLMGQPHRIGKLDALLSSITSHDDVWCATATEIIEASGGPPRAPQSL